MKYFAFMMLIVFAGMAIFGFAMMNYEMDHMMGLEECPLASMLAFACTPDAISMAIQHVSAFQTFSNNTLVVPFALSLAVALAAVLLAWLALTFSLSQILSPVYLQSGRSDEIKYYSSCKISSWLSLLENAPSIS